MKINTYLIQLGIITILVFGVTFSIYYFRSGYLLLDQMIGTSVGVVLLIGSLIWRKLNK
ncbi:hypothetical protein ABET51_21530 [Metabacillus fastidiosus]|uniref:hypothetical protein n=1 Tax=Metabacillus fastidiosus TaxID=1458 RepID=UPI003D2C8B85